MNPSKIIIFLIVLYCFVGQFIESFIGIPYVRFSSFIGLLIFVPFYYINKKDIKLAQISIVVIIVAMVYFLAGSKPPTSALYTILFGYLFFKEKLFSKKMLDVIFGIQIFLLLYETIIGSFLYSDITTGIFTTKDVEGSAELTVNENDETGFRPKGLYMGTLEAAAFNIYYCLINKDCPKRVFCAFMVSFIINGRLSILISTFVLFIYLYKQYRSKIKIVSFLLCFLIGVIISSILYTTSDFVQKRTDRILSAFDISDNSNNGGRLMFYYFAYDEYFNVYDNKSKIFGSEYEIHNEWGKTVSAESDLLSMLLEMGIVGTFIYLFAFANMFRYNSNAVISTRMVTLLTLIAYLEYRHATGNIRGTLFWFLYFTAINPPNYLVGKKTG